MLSMPPRKWCTLCRHPEDPPGSKGSRFCPAPHAFCPWPHPAYFDSARSAFCWTLLQQVAKPPRHQPIRKTPWTNPRLSDASWAPSFLTLPAFWEPAPPTPGVSGGIWVPVWAQLPGAAGRSSEGLGLPGLPRTKTRRAFQAARAPPAAVFCV